MQIAGLQASFRVACGRHRLRIWIEYQEIGRRNVLIIRGPHTLAAAADRTVDHAAARQVAVAEDIDHHRLVLAGRVLETRADAHADTAGSRLTVGSVARVIDASAHVESATSGSACSDA